MKLLLTLVAVFAFFTIVKADDVKESRFIDENAFKALLDLTRQAKPTNPAAALKSQYPYLSQKERLTLQDERQTRYPLQPLNVEYALLPQSLLTQSHPTTQTKDALVDVKPIYIPYALKNQPTFTPQAAYQSLTGFQAIAEQPQPQLKPSYVTSYPINNLPTEQTKQSAFFAAYPALKHKQTAQSSNIALEHKQPVYHAYQNLFAYANQAPSQLTYQQTRPDPSYQRYTTTNSPSFIIISPTNYPTYHYYAATNYSFPRAVAIADESVVPIEAEEEMQEQTKDLHLETVHFGQSSTDRPPVEVRPILATLPNALTNDEGILAEALLEQSRQPENLNNLLELLQREQLKRRMQERVAAFYFRNLNLNKK